jgi:hypothetical protein
MAEQEQEAADRLAILIEYYGNGEYIVTLPRVSRPYVLIRKNSKMECVAMGISANGYHNKTKSFEPGAYLSALAWAVDWIKDEYNAGTG